MATQLNVVNDILRRLRETEVSSVASTDYSVLIAMFVNDAKEDLEDMWFWTVNETEIDTTILSDGTRDYDLTDTTDRSFMVRRNRDNFPMAFDITTDEQGPLYDRPMKEIRIYRNTFPGTPPDVDIPQMFGIKPDADGRGYTLELQDGSTTTRSWRTYWYVPQAELALDGTDDTTEIKLPQRAVFLQALFYALNERGEEMGEPGGVAEMRAKRAASAAMELDMQVNKKSDDNDMTNLEAMRNSIHGESV